LVALTISLPPTLFLLHLKQLQTVSSLYFLYVYEARQPCSLMGCTVEEGSWLMGLTELKERQMDRYHGLFSECGMGTPEIPELFHKCNKSFPAVINF
jgi:hypothetical protein